MELPDRAIRKYLKQTGRKLLCSPQTKAFMLKGLEDEICDTLAGLEVSAYEALSFENLVSLIGPINDMSEYLQENIDLDEFNRYSRRKKRLQQTGLLLVIIFILFLLYLVIQMASDTQVKVTEEIIVNYRHE